MSNNFFDRLKQGAAEAGKKAQLTVEVNRLKLQISSKEKEIQRQYTQMGELVYRHAQQHGVETIPADCVRIVDEINRMRSEINQIEQKIRSLKSEVHCPACGKVNPTGTNFCTSCGTHLVQPAAAPIEVEVLDRRENLEDTENDSATPKCASCGREVMEGKPFCHHCGAAVQP
ncbi:double zinc ribbon domain-containing protein [Marinicrinis lubricantis]|uniref:Zinc ribbon domain-containing protein n=1 Tax=Marinicrinis lubricantis TaxID=2086470 RepID=A0ABW1IS40_9BACL